MEIIVDCALPTRNSELQNSVEDTELPRTHELSNVINGRASFRKQRIVRLEHMERAKGDIVLYSHIPCA